MSDKRRQQRRKEVVPVTIRGIDRTGLLFNLRVSTLDVGDSGARLDGVTARLEVGAVVAVQHKTVKALFRVAWVGVPGSPEEGHVGVRCMEMDKHLWPAPAMTFRVQHLAPPEEFLPTLVGTPATARESNTAGD